MTALTRGWLFALSTVLTFSYAYHAKAQSIPNFYKGKQIQVLIGFGAGGSNDLWGRIVGRHIGKHIPGNPTVLPQNMPGAGSMRVANHIYNVAPKDGTVMGVIARGIPLEPLFRGTGANFDARKFTYIGTPTRDTTICAVDANLPQKAPEDFFKYETIVGSSGTGAETNAIPLILKNVLGMKFKIITGYEGGGTDVMLAIERRELHGVCFAYENLENQALYRDGRVRAAFQVSLRPDPNLKNIPNVFALRMTEEQREVLGLLFVREPLGRPFVAPPNIPPQRVDALRNGFDKTMTDPEFVAEAKKLNLTIHPAPGQQLAKIITNAYAARPELANRAAAALGR